MNFKIVIFTILMACILLLHSCGGHIPSKEWGNEYTRLVDYELTHEHVKIRSWSTGSDVTTAVIIAISRAKGKIPDLKVGWKASSENGLYNKIELFNGSTVMQIPLYNDSLVKSERIPVYYSIDDSTIHETTVSVDEFGKIKNAINDKNSDIIIAILRGDTQQGNSNAEPSGDGSADR